MSGWTSEIKEKLWEKCLTGMVSFVCLIIAHSYCPLHSSSGSHASGSDSTGWPVFESTGSGPEVVWSWVSISVVRWRGDCCRPQLYVTKVCRLFTTIENPSYFFMTLSCTEAIQIFISHFNQYSLVDPSWGNIPSWVWHWVSHWFRKLRCRVWHHRHFGNWISWK